MHPGIQASCWKTPKRVRLIANVESWASAGFTPQIICSIFTDNGARISVVWIAMLAYWPPQTDITLYIEQSALNSCTYEHLFFTHTHTHTHTHAHLHK